MFNPLTISIGKAVQALASARGGGSALPGRVVEKIDPHFASEVLGTLPYGVVLVSGTNGKTTTVKIVSELLAAAGLRVFTNNTGSNFMRGVISSLLRRVNLKGELEADIAVLELDEAHAVNFVEEIQPRYTLLLNVMRDQLDRFGEIDYTAKLLTVVARNTTGVLVLNSEDSRLAALPETEDFVAEVRWFGLAPALRSEFPDDDSLYDEELFGVRQEKDSSLILKMTEGGQPEQSYCKAEQDSSLTLKMTHSREADSSHLSRLMAFSKDTAQFDIEGTACEANLALKGIYNAYNATAALALAHAILPDTPLASLCTALSQVHSAFGRGEVFDVEGQPVEMILVKNPAGFRLALKSFDATGWQTMIAVNDHYGDGRDVSWFFDVPFTSFKETGVAMITGLRAYDMALRLEHDEVPIGAVEPDPSIALKAFLAEHPNTPKRIYCSYTMMMELRTLLAGITNVERIQ